MNYKIFKGVAHTITQCNAWKALVESNATPRRIDLPSTPGNLSFRGATLAFTKQSLEGRYAYNHFLIEATKGKGPLEYKEWRTTDMANIKFKVGGSKKDVVDVLENMAGDSMCDGTWAGYSSVS